MKASGIAGVWVAAVAVAMLSAGGCRSTQTDRIRVLEAQKADAEKRSEDLTHELALSRSNQIEVESALNSERARAEALQAQVEMLRGATPGTEARKPATAIDASALERELRGAGVTVSASGNGGATIVLASDVTFRPGRADLSQQACAILDKVARALMETRGVRTVRVEGHTDSDPIRRSGWKDNHELSLARAEMVQKYLLSRGIAEDLLAVQGHGEDRPVAPNDSTEGKARNRRVEIVLLAEG